MSSDPGTGAVQRAREALRLIDASDRPEIWISRRDPDAVLADAELVERRVAAGAALPLAGLTVAVKDNIDFSGLPTTAACSDFAYQPARSAAAVERLCQAGAIVIGKTNLDQFATGLVGTRSPYGAVRDARRPEYVSGGSSSGSAVAVALGLVDLALGTDTAGSGRVPAAFQGIFGLKPTWGLVSTQGVVPACWSFDCVSLFSRTLALGRQALAVIAGGADSRQPPLTAPLGAPPQATVAVPDHLPGLSAAAAEVFATTAERVRSLGHEVVTVEIEPFLAAGRLLYGGALVAERYAAVGEFVSAYQDRVDPAVAAIIDAAQALPAHQLVHDQARLAALRLECAQMMSAAGADALLVPTTTGQPLISEVSADPIGRNLKLGTYSTFANLLDLCAVAVPAGQADGSCFGVTLLGPAFADELVLDLAADLSGEGRDEGAGLPVPAATLFVVGAHRTGQPLNGQLTERGGRCLGPRATTAAYRLYRLDTQPVKPGLVRSEPGASIEGELWALPPGGFSDFVQALPTPMALGRVNLADGSDVIGFLCEPAALIGAREITEFASWPAYLAAAGAAA